MNFENTVELKEFECRFCNKIFGNNQTLLQHQKKTKYCIYIQKNSFFFENTQMIKEDEEKTEYMIKKLVEDKVIQCQFCNNMFANIILLYQHQKRAKYCLKIQEIKEKEQHVALAKSIEETKQRKETEELALKEKSKELSCQFCGKQCKNKYILNNHQTQAKYCLKIQESKNSQEMIIANLVLCEYCSKNFSRATFKRHDSTCKKKIQYLTQEIEMMKLKSEKDQEIAILKLKAEKDEEIAILKAEKDEEINLKEKEISLIYKASAEHAQAVANRALSTIDEIAKQPTYQKNSTRNIHNNLNLMISSLTPLDLSQAHVDSIIDEKYTKNDFYEGQKGAAQVVYKYLSTDSDGKSQIVCTDTERGTFHHIDINGEHVVDYKNVHLIKSVHLPLKRKAGKFAAEECVKNPEAFKEIIMNESSIRELETKPSLFNRTMAQLTGKNCARPLITTSVDQPPPILSITEEWLLENTKFLTIDHILRGPEGYADYFMSYPLKDRLHYSNAVVKFKDGFGELIDDAGAVILSKLIFDSVQVRNKQIIMEYCTSLNFADNGAEIVQLLDYKMAVEKCAEGNYVGDEDVDFRREFIEFLLI